uniref:Prophage protein n=1 Tax=uncultured bacterium scaffold00056 TaxID=1132475 RepID=I7AI63_9BACT|nr:prophage protein [uncultured bacterium scaffold00056]
MSASNLEELLTSVIGAVNGNDESIADALEQAGLTQTQVESLSEDMITSVTTYYYQSTSATELTGGSWSTVSPAWTEGTYIWTRDLITYGNGSSVYGEAVCITGNSGKDGEDGEDAVLLQIESTNGNMFRNTDIATILTVTVIVAGAAITSTRQLAEAFGSGARLLWQYKGYGETEFSDIPEDDPRLSDGGFLFTLTAADVKTKAVFNCSLDY